MFRTFKSTTTGLLAAAALAGGVVLAAAPAHAELEIQLQSGGNTYTQTGVSPLSIDQSIGDFSLSLDTGLASAGPSLDLSSLNSSGSTPGTLVITLSENGLTAPLGAENWLTQLSGTVVSSGAVTVSLQSYLDNTNTLLGTGTALSTLTSSAATFGVSGVADASTTGPFAITEVLTVTAAGASTTSLDTAVTAVPEPASLALLGSALFGVGLVRRRRNGGGSVSLA